MNIFFYNNYSTNTQLVDNNLKYVLKHIINLYFNLEIDLSLR